ncbi:hypothetical protein J41TS12_14290 [Paenibacillus antibioticophila]|uniref:DUF4145 domain-containing protein n=1 Tax=Paenibacillus antibioticophila TaxID=1274374 RepID=A0A920CG91_9BACL|nr:DUF4145 domain-containing protein [Paenibacillus antibioticophila]GIO36568.1 hypothetical protein J41TS12_14290 [Paenibacillus antibioticophila]
MLHVNWRTVFFYSPRTMLTHARTFVENILQKVIQAEKLPEEQRSGFLEKIDLLNKSELLTPEIRNDLHSVRKLGNEAAHDTRMFRYSEALSSWESIYRIVKWYIEVYGPVSLDFPNYQDPSTQKNPSLGIVEIQERLKAVEELLVSSLRKTKVESESLAAEEAAIAISVSEAITPGLTTVRTITYKDQYVDIPYFLRDAFLLPQRFEKSETFLIRLGAEQQARIMSELPNNLEGLNRYTKRYNEKHEGIFFEELKQYIEEEKNRRRLMLERPGELFFFFKDDYIVVTEELSQILLNTEEFTGFPNLLKQLNEDQMTRVEHLPKELVILAKYNNVGISTVEKLFRQLKEKQKENMNI